MTALLIKIFSGISELGLQDKIEIQSSKCPIRTFISLEIRDKLFSGPPSGSVIAQPENYSFFDQNVAPNNKFALIAVS